MTKAKFEIGWIDPADGGWKHSKVEADTSRAAKKRFKSEFGITPLSIKSIRR